MSNLNARPEPRSKQKASEKVETHRARRAIARLCASIAELSLIVMVLAFFAALVVFLAQEMFIGDAVATWNARYSRATAYLIAAGIGSAIIVFSFYAIAEAIDRDTAKEGYIQKIIIKRFIRVYDAAAAAVKRFIDWK